ncbi:Rv0909 family putative TA system antitoxin [Plantibacter sp. RU18]|uniref:Rv0909 family putative TA system antitoxin n=1 Tax=Plantibacter sp. RU18 TaxID=3158143 RepID=UPI003D36A61A
MGIEDVTGKAKEFLANNAVKDALQSEQAENISDKVLDGTAEAVNKVTGNKFDEQVGAAKDAADKRIGNE